MSEISNKKKKFIKRNFKQLSLEELVRKTELKPNVVRLLIEKYSSKIPGKGPSVQTNNGDLNVPSLKIILITTLLFVTAAFIIYFPSLHGQFIFDDGHFIQNSSLVHISRLSQLTDLLFSKDLVRRIGIMSFALNYYFGGLNPVGYHLVNVIIHILNGFILFLLSYTVLTLPLDKGEGRGNAFKISFLGSLLWLVHPVQTQSVSYIYQRLVSLSTLFFLLSFLCYIKGRLLHAHKRVALFICSVIFGLLALGTKQNTATLPLFVILSEFLFFQPKPLKLDRKKLVLLIFLGGLFIFTSVIYLTLDFYPSLCAYTERVWETPIQRLLTQLRVVIFYISLLIYPHPSRLNIDHSFALSFSLFSPFTTFLSLLFIIGSLVLAFFLIKRNRLASFAIIWFFGNLAIESIIPLELVFEHRIYLPSIGFIILVVGLAVSIPRREWKKWVTGFIILLIPLLSYWTYERASVWREPLSLWMDATKKSPNKARPHYNLGRAYEDKEMLDEAVSEYKKTLAILPRYVKAYNSLALAYYDKGLLDEAISELEKALAIEPNFAEAHNNLGNAYSKKGRLDEAISEFKQALAINPNNAEAHNNLGNAYSKKGRLDEAISKFKQALVINPNNAKAHNNLALAYYEKGLLDEAIYELKKALAINPNFAEARNNLGLVYVKKGMLDEAIPEYKKAHTINPNNAEAHNNLGNAYSKKGRLDEAISEFKQALAINPNNEEVHNNLAAVYYEKGLLDEAISELKKALAINPNFAEARNNLGLVYVKKGMLDEAIPEYKKAHTINPNYAEAHSNLGNAYSKKGRLDEAISEFKQALAINPNNEEVHNNLAAVYYEKGLLDEAISELKKALAINPNFANAHNNLATAYHSKGNYKLAIFHCDRATELGYRVNPELLESLQLYR